MARAREDILAQLRTALGRREGDGAGKRADERIARHAANLMPARGQIPHAAQIELFIDMAERTEATVARVGSGDDVPAAVAEYLAERNLPTNVAMAPDPGLDALPWRDQPLLSLRRGRAEETDEVGLTGAFAAIAETGTLMMMSGAEQPTSLNFLPENHIVVLNADQMTGTYEEAWTRLREACPSADGDGFALPRTVNLITGPSRTADIELVPTLGAHGPKRLHIILVDEGGDGAG